MAEFFIGITSSVSDAHEGSVANSAAGASGRDQSKLRAGPGVRPGGMTSCGSTRGLASGAFD